MNRHLFMVVLALLCILPSQRILAEHVERWKWEAKFPREYAQANSYPVHGAKFDLHKAYRFSRTGKIQDLYRELGRPDRYSKQPFYSDKFAEPLTPTSPQGGTFLYIFQDGTRLFVPATTGGISFVVVYSKGHKPQILYK